MAEMRWVHCNHCDQDLFTNNSVKCDACGGKLDGSRDHTRPEAIRDVVASQQRGDAGITGQIARGMVDTYRTYRFYRLVVGLVACPLGFLIGLVLTIHPMDLINSKDKWTLAAAFPGIVFMAVSVAGAGLGIWSLRRMNK
jgi:hypothetical protein